MATFGRERVLSALDVKHRRSRSAETVGVASDGGMRVRRR
jgi:hypothetical protein